MHNKFVQLRWGAALAALTLLTAPAVLVAQTDLELSGVGALRYVNHMDTTITGTNPLTGSPFTRPVPGYAYDASANDRFMLSQLRFSAVATSGDTSTHATLVLGEDASGNQALTGLGAGTADLEEMYVEQKLQDNLTIIAGKFATWQGWEVVSPTDNTNISRGLLYQNTEAVTHIGAAVKYKLNDQVAIWGGFVNGWDVVVDNNNAKTLITRVDLTLMDEKLVGGVNLYYGAEGASSGQKTLSIDATFNYTVSDTVSVAFQVIQGSQEKSATTASTSWFGIGVWPTIKVNDDLSVGIRVESFSDGDDARVGAGFPGGVSYFDIAVTPALQLSDDVQARAELRMTTASEDVFLDGDLSFGGSIMTLAFELVWKF